MSPKQIVLISSIAMFIIAGAVVLFFLDPTKHAFFPKCAFQMATGLTHGNVLEAFRLNPGILCLLTMGVTDFGRYIRSTTQARPHHTLFANTWLVIGLVVGMVVYAVLRNLPWMPFTSLAP